MASEAKESMVGQFPSRHMKPNQESVCVYMTERERDAMDAEYVVKVTDLKIGPDKDKIGGSGSVTMNGLHRSFPLNVPVKLYGFQIRALKGSTYLVPEVKWDEDAGQIKQTGRLLDTSRFTVQREDSEFGV